MYTEGTGPTYSSVFFTNETTSSSSVLIVLLYVFGSQKKNVKFINHNSETALQLLNLKIKHLKCWKGCVIC